eukprot:COSAG06_NODE_21874_length_742_cov_1.275272_1_plen_171_part_01
MKQMPSLPTLASVLCHIATVSVVLHGRTDLRGSHRNLESTDPPHNPLVMQDPLAQTVARLEKAVDMHGVRLTTVERGNVELTTLLNEHMEGHEGTGHGGRHTLTTEAQLLQNTTGNNIQAQLRSFLQRRDNLNLPNRGGAVTVAALGGVSCAEGYIGEAAATCSASTTSGA